MQSFEKCLLDKMQPKTCENSALLIWCTGSKAKSRHSLKPEMDWAILHFYDILKNVNVDERLKQFDLLESCFNMVI